MLWHKILTTDSLSWSASLIILTNSVSVNVGGARACSHFGIKGVDPLAIESMPPERTLGLVRRVIALAIDAMGFVRAGHASQYRRNWWVGVGTALAAPSDLAVLVLGVRTSAPGTHAPICTAGLRGVTPPAAAIAEGDAPSHLCGLDKGAHTVYLDGVVGKDVSHEATGLAVPDVEID